MTYPSPRGLLPLSFHKHHQNMKKTGDMPMKSTAEKRHLTSSDFRIHPWKSESNYVNDGLSADKVLKWHQAEEHPHRPTPSAESGCASPGIHVPSRSSAPTDCETGAFLLSLSFTLFTIRSLMNVNADMKPEQIPASERRQNCCASLVCK